ncbi:transglycosylase SLT domain-containing protein [Acetobacter sp. TBRC 12305]|uniref:Transglycosylase SLT domain-containing protein n=2 Tax=Acetobacter garciniae TaxID=2817435 RepID=A0A939HMA7_9PROT|nr:transglycosylase SLT domain-containing protein [Acetobacter garciniae]MBO1326147.1 transglycosylase SLT domain-containing protein [Acetobacter garciniae]MBX0345109.1 transglycosylase SLT domain-containing protein [Acetobacter garciniae]
MGWQRVRAGLALGALAVLAACAGPSRSYRPPGSALNPWGPYIREASQRFSIPQGWIRAVMWQESGGHQYIHGQLTRSVHGAVGLMQVKPDTYHELAQRYGLGSDPYDPHDNIMAGSGYIRELYDRFGSPDFLAAYSCGPQCMANYRAGSGSLPGYARSYLAAVAPHLNDPVPAVTEPGPEITPLSTPVRVVADSTPAPAENENAQADAQAAASDMQAPNAAPVAVASADMPAPESTPGGPADTTVLGPGEPDTTSQALRAPGMAGNGSTGATPAVASPPIMAGTTASSTLRGRGPALVWQQNAQTGNAVIQIGAFSTQSRARDALRLAHSTTQALNRATDRVEPVQHGAQPIWRTRIAGLPAGRTQAICASLRQQGLSCVTVSQ